MKKLLPIRSALAAALFALTWVAAGASATNDLQSNFPFTVKFELGEAEFAPGDNITITAVHGTRDVIATNETYCVEGAYTLGSHDKAELSLFATVANSGPTPIDPRQTMRVTKGAGTFRLIKTMSEDGYLHVSFYEGSAFGGVYFGQGAWVLHHKGFSYLDESAHSPDFIVRGLSSQASSSGPNQAMLEYLGNPVPPPPDMAAAYSKQGLRDAVQLAAKNAGISLSRVEVDDSEFPFILCVRCRDGDWEKLAVQIEKLAGYNYTGRTGGRTCNAFNLVPGTVFPQESRSGIFHRLPLREQMLLDRIDSQR